MADGGEVSLWDAIDKRHLRRLPEWGKPSLLLTGASGPVFVPKAKSGLPDQLLFVRGGTLYARAIDAEKVELRGAAVSVAEDVGYLRARSQPAFSAAATGVLGFGRGRHVPDRELVWLDRNGKKLQTVSRPSPQMNNPAIRLSPDRSRAIVPVEGATGPDLWTADLNRNTLSRFTFDGATSGIWSADGRKVLWAATKNGNRYLRSADGSGQDELLFTNPSGSGSLKTGLPMESGSPSKTKVFGCWGPKGMANLIRTTRPASRKIGASSRLTASGWRTAQTNPVSMRLSWNRFRRGKAAIRSRPKAVIGRRGGATARSFSFDRARS